MDNSSWIILLSIAVILFCQVLMLFVIVQILKKTNKSLAIIENHLEHILGKLKDDE
ncbi:MAG: hypothetical protein OXD54_11675 [Candidatus Poribacteria bacterium]|nr:hypothetical protein [Candidatus Poribacteria bacterium]